jgi:hypothetical protein
LLKLFFIGLHQLAPQQVAHILQAVWPGISTEELFERRVRGAESRILHILQPAGDQVVCVPLEGGISLPITHNMSTTRQRLDTLLACLLNEDG